MPDVKYPHMFGAESDIWDEFLVKYGGLYTRFEYDVHVGKLWPELENLPPNYLEGAKAVYQKRIDVVGFQPDVITIFEVKPHAGLGALGQIMGYLALYDEDFSPTDELRGAIVTRLVDPNIERIFHDTGIELYIFPEA